MKMENMCQCIHSLNGSTRRYGTRPWEAVCLHNHPDVWPGLVAQAQENSTVPTGSKLSHSEAHATCPAAVTAQKAPEEANMLPRPRAGLTATLELHFWYA